MKKFEGQLRCIQNMVQQERDCVDIMVQLAAVKAALHSVAAQVLRNYTNSCLEKKKGNDIGIDLAHAISIWIGERV